ncbi:MAG: Flp pilus assembly protein CpaB [Planctomycetales bacterium]|nr:Flp pilus assembly protein CpaB [Planctomycetales bacterium]
MKSQTVVVLILALICGGSAAVGVSQLLNGQGPDGSTTKIVVAKADVARGHLLNAESLDLRDWPKGSLPSGALSSIDAAVERTALMPLYKGEPILETKLASKDAGRGLAAVIPHGKRAFTIETPHVAAGVGGFILPGNRVDILLTTEMRGKDDVTGGGATTTLLQNIEILAVDQHLDKPDSNKVDPKTLKSVTVLVSPDQAAKLDLGMNKGTLHLSLRNPEDNLEADTKPATMAELQFHQESPDGTGPSLFGQTFGAVASALAASPNAEEEAAADNESKSRSETGRIRTLRGTHRGYVRVER